MILVMIYSYDLQRTCPLLYCITIIAAANSLNLAHPQAKDPFLSGVPSDHPSRKSSGKKCTLI